MATESGGVNFKSDINVNFSDSQEDLFMDSYTGRSIQNSGLLNG